MKVLSLHMEVYLFYFFLNVCPFDCRTVDGSGKVGPLNLKLTTPVG